MESKLSTSCVNTIRCLAADMVQKANSGHPGAPMGLAPAAHVLWSKVMTYAPTDAKWPNRDRFVLSNGHACALLYSMLHLSGYSLSLKDLQNFRQLHSLTPGHPENTETEGVEVTTGPLGQGIANATGMALSQAHLAAVYNKPSFPLFDNYTYVFTGDGCLQEGLASEAASLAGHWRLGKLIVLYDDNNIQIDGSTDMAFTEDVVARFLSYHWDVQTVADGNTDMKGIEEAIEKAKLVTDKPSLICLKTVIGYGSLKEGTHGVHGSPLGYPDIKQLKEKLGLDPEKSFQVDDSVYSSYQSSANKGNKKMKEWKQMLAKYGEEYPELHKELTRRLSGELIENYKDVLPNYDEISKSIATRSTSGSALVAVADVMHELVGGSADLTPSNKTQLPNTADFQYATPEGRYLRFGVREHAMISIANGMCAYGGFIPFTATFLNFIQYGFPAVRLAAISKFRQILIMTHDSIGVGEDGPTHQPIEAVSMCRACPNVLTLRPADGRETNACYIAALEKKDGPSVLCLSRQNLPQLEGSSTEKALLGGYVLMETGEEKEVVDVVLVATGSEVSLAVETAKLMAEEDKIKVRVVSMPCTELFDTQPLTYRQEILLPNVPSVSIEAACTQGWGQYAHFQIGIDRFGLSAPAPLVYQELGLTATQIQTKVNKMMSAFKQHPSYLQSCYGL